MQGGEIRISQKELTRYDVLRRVLDGTIGLKDAAVYLGVSYRQAKRLKKRAEDGPGGLVHGNRGRPPSNRLPETLRREVLSLSQEEFSCFNDTHFTEELTKRGVDISRECVRRLRREAGIGPKRKRKPRRHHRRRPRKTSEGLMILWDGSPHRWFGEEVGPCCLMAAMDDATGKVLGLFFCEHECSWAYLELLRRVVREYGVPCSIYQDKHTALKRNDEFWSLEEELAGRQEPTQVGRALEEMGIQTIFANSPQAKGRIEKLFETLQDRLAATFKREGITDIASANGYLDGGFREEFNDRFAHPAPGDHRWRRLGPGADLEKICSFVYAGTVAGDNAVRFCGLVFDVDPGPGGRSYAGTKVELRQLLDGSWRIYYQDRMIAAAPPTEVGEPFRAKRRRKGVKAAYHCEWVYLASRQAGNLDGQAPATRPTTSIRRHPGQPIAATRIA